MTSCCRHGGTATKRTHRDQIADAALFAVTGRHYKFFAERDTMRGDVSSIWLEYPEAVNVSRLLDLVIEPLVGETDDPVSSNPVSALWLFMKNAQFQFILQKSNLWHSTVATLDHTLNPFCWFSSTLIALSGEALVSLKAVTSVISARFEAMFTPNMQIWQNWDLMQHFHLPILNK